MSDEDRNKIDSEVQEFIQTYADHIKAVRKLIGSNSSKLAQIKTFLKYITILF